MEIDQETGRELVETASAVIQSNIRNGKIYRVSSPNRIFEENLGVFVTIKENGMLRGCIGYIDPPWELRETIVKASIASATEDPRFTPVKERELDNITVEVTILDHPEQIRVAGKQDFGKIEIGKHGLIIEYGSNKGVLLPQVAVEESLDPQDFLDATCEKAGLQPKCWQKDGCKVYRFAGYVFG